MDKLERQRAISMAKDNANLLIASGFLDHSADFVRAWYRYDLRWSNEDGGFLTFPVRELEALAKNARSDAAVFDLVKFAASTRIAENVEIPSQLRTLIADYLSGKFRAPAKKGGRQPDWGRNFIIINTMKRLLEVYDIRPTANRHPLGVRERAPSASEILVEALRETKIGYMDVARIQRVWNDGKAKDLDGVEIHPDHDEAYGLYVTSMFDDEPGLTRV